jgi:hypothetical protein
MGTTSPSTRRSPSCRFWRPWCALNPTPLPVRSALSPLFSLSQCAVLSAHSSKVAPPQAWVLLAAPFVVSQGRSVFMAFGTTRASGSAHHLLMTAVFRAPTAFFDTTPTGRILNRFSKDADTIDTQVRARERQRDERETERGLCDAALTVADAPALRSSRPPSSKGCSSFSARAAPSSSSAWCCRGSSSLSCPSCTCSSRSATVRPRPPFEFYP